MVHVLHDCHFVDEEIFSSFLFLLCIAPIITVSLKLHATDLTPHWVNLVMSTNTGSNVPSFFGCRIGLRMTSPFN